MKQPVRTLATLALIGACAPSAMAVTIKDDTVSLGLGVRLQTRAQMSDATDINGQDYRVATGTANAVNDPLDLSIRRSRLYLKIKYGDDWKGELAFSGDSIDANGGKDSGSRGVQVRYAWVERGFKFEDGMKAALGAGLIKPQQNPTHSRCSSSSKLFPNSDAAEPLLDPRSVGIFARFEHPIFAVFGDVQNNDSGLKDTSNANSAQEEEGFYYGARVEFSFSPDLFIAKRAESFVGKDGTGVVIGASYEVNDTDVNATNTTTQTAIGVDALFHWNGISAFAEYRMLNTEVDAYAGGVTETDAAVILAQLGYAFKLENGCVIEPAIRYQIIDNDTDNDNEMVNYGNNAESGDSGNQIDLGINYYLDGHHNKFQLAVSLWEAEEGQADATIIRLQHQLNF